MNLFTADVGQGKVHVYDSDNDKFHPKLPQENFINLNISELKRGDVMVVECAHLRESHRLTLAQPFDFSQLEKLEKNANQKGITILLFPQKSTPKARKLAGVEADAKTDEADTRAIASFLKQDKNAFNSLKKFVPTKLKTFQEKNSYIFDYLQQCNEDINTAKTCGYGFDKNIPYEDNVSRWIKKYTVDGGSSVFGYTPTLVDYLKKEYPKDYKELIWAIGLTYDKKGNLKIAVPNRIYTLVHSIIRPNTDELRLRRDIGEVPFWKFIKDHYLGCKPYHMNQGVAASNYKHWMRRAVSEYAFPNKKSANSTDFQVGMSYEELVKLKKARTKVDKMTQKIWNVLRKMIVEDELR